MHLFGAILRICCARTVGETHIAGDRGADGTAHEDLHHRVEGLHVRQQPLHPHEHDLRLRKRCDHAPVAFVGEDTRRSCRSNGEIAAGDADIRSEEFLAQLCARKKRHLVGFHGAAVALLHKKIVGCFDVHVHPRHDQVRRMVPVVELHHVLTKVRLVDLNAIGKQRFVAAHFF